MMFIVSVLYLFCCVTKITKRRAEFHDDWSCPSCSSFPIVFFAARASMSLDDERVGRVKLIFVIEIVID